MNTGNADVDVERVDIGSGEQVPVSIVLISLGMWTDKSTVEWEGIGRIC